MASVLLGAHTLHGHKASRVQLPSTRPFATFVVGPTPVPLAVAQGGALLQQAAATLPPPTSTLGSPSLPPLPDVGIESDKKHLLARPLPQGSESWTRLEKHLYLLSHGAYHPGLMAQRRRIPGLSPLMRSSVGTGSRLEARGRVSMVVPTMSSRQRYHEQLWANFEAQTWSDKELIVVETYTTAPSAYLQQKAKEDPRFILISFPVPSTGDFSVGLKRNMTLHLASGEYVVNFDDDDVYAPTYVTRMVGEMQARGLAGLTLSSWFNYFELSGTCGYTDPDSWSSEQLDDGLDEVLFGYGFSYVHLRRAGIAFPYPDEEFAEDYPFFGRLRDVLGPNRVDLKVDETGLCMHIVHPKNSAGAMPVSRCVPLAEVGKLEVAPVFQGYLDRHTTALVHMYRSVVERCNLAVESLSGILPSRREKLRMAKNKRLTHRRVQTY